MSGAELICPSCGERSPSHFGKCWKCQGDLKAAAAAPASRAARARCSWCDGTDLELGVAVGSGEPHRTLAREPITVGLLFAGVSALKDLQGGSLEVLRADLCKECGTVVRFYVDEVDRVWLKHD